MERIPTRRVDSRRRKSSIDSEPLWETDGVPVFTPFRSQITPPPLTGKNYGIQVFDNQKIDLKDCTFIIPVSFDSIHRKQNLELVISYILKHFDTHIIVGEQGTDEFEYVNKHCIYMKFDYKEFHRTKMLNEMTRVSGTPIVFNWDADVFASPMQILKTAELLRSGEADFVYCYDGRFARVSREYADLMFKHLDVGIFAGKTFSGMEQGAMVSVGGAVAYNKESFWKIGGENENFISYNPEDVCRKIRMDRLGFVVKRVRGAIYHLDHHISIDSSMSNPNFNQHELNKIANMTKGELEKYISTWSWAKT